MLQYRDGVKYTVNYKYVYFPIAKYKYNHFHIVEYKYSLSSTNTNFKMLIYFTIPILLLTTTHFPTFYFCNTYCKFASFDHKTRRTYVILSIYASYSTRVTIAGYFCDLAMSYQMCIRLVFVLNTSNIPIKYKQVNSVMVTYKHEFNCISYTNTYLTPSLLQFDRRLSGNGHFLITICP